jgi:hypothetical protein
MRKVLWGLLSSLLVASLSSIAAAQRILDVEADPVHYKVELENDCVYVSRANFGPHEKMPSFFDAKDAVLVSLTDSEGLKLTYPDGHVRYTSAFHAGAVYWARAAGRIQQENAGDTRLEFIAIELKRCN